MENFYSKLAEWFQILFTYSENYSNSLYGAEGDVLPMTSCDTSQYQSEAETLSETDDHGYGRSIFYHYVCLKPRMYKVLN